MKQKLELFGVICDLRHLKISLAMGDKLSFTGRMFIPDSLSWHKLKFIGLKYEYINPFKDRLDELGLYRKVGWRVFENPRFFLAVNARGYFKIELPFIDYFLTDKVRISNFQLRLFRRLSKEAYLEYTEEED